MATIPVDSRIDSKTAEFFSRHHRMLIDGRFVPAASGKTFPVYNPATGEVVARVPEAEEEDVNRAVSAARRAFDEGPWSKKLSPSERGQMLWKLADLLQANLEEFAEIESLDNGKPLSVARVADVPLTIDMFRYMAGWATKIGGSTLSFSTPGAFHSYTMREPVGVVGQIIPWNFPLLMAAWELAPALATGCTVVLKVAEETPLAALRWGEMVQEAGVPPGVVNIVTGFGETAGAALAAHPGVDKVAFTGSTEVGRLIVQAAARDLKHVSLELGGKSPNIILKDADLDVAIPGAANAIFFNHGQCCCAGSRLFVQEKSYDRVLEGVSNAARAIRVGPGLNPQSEMGPLVSKVQFDRVTGFLRSGKEEGARTVTGGKRHGETGYFVEPTVLDGTSDKMRVYQEEIFGPVVTVMPFKDVDDELIRRANDTVYGLAAGLWTSNIKRAHRIANQLRAGTVWGNCYNIFDAAMPFGGYKQSGWGREMGSEVLKNYLETKSVCMSV